MFAPSLKGLKGKAPQLLFLVIVAVLVAIILADTLEDVLIEGGSFAGTPLDSVLNAIVNVTQGVTATVSSWGYAGIFLFMLLESSSVPIPSEVILPFSGYLVSLGLLNMWVVVLVSTVAGIAGSMIDYYVGMKGTVALERRKILDRALFGKVRFEMVERWFDKYGVAAVFLSRMVPAFRTLVSFPAGAVKMPLRKFVPYTMAGCLIWNIVLVYLGFYVGINWREVASVSHYLILGAVAALLLTFVTFWIRRKRRLSADKNPAVKSDIALLSA